VVPRKRRRSSPRAIVETHFAFDLEVSLSVTLGAPAEKWSPGRTKHLTGNSFFN
jgi:hypothetical protein